MAWKSKGLCCEVFEHSFCRSLRVGGQIHSAHCCGESFPEAFKTPPEEDSAFNELADRALEQMCLDSTDYLIDKLQQFNALRESHAAVVLAGPPFSGKTTLRRALRIVTRLRGCEVHMDELCPKALDAGEFYGRFDAEADESTLGALTGLLAQAAGRAESESWIVLDGGDGP